MLEQTLFELALARRLAQPEKIELIGILEDLLRQIGLGSRQGAPEIRRRPALPQMQTALDLVNQDVAAPAMLDGGPGIPAARFGIGDFFEQGDLVPPGQLCKDTLHEVAVRLGRGEGPYVFEVPGRPAGNAGKLAPQIGSQTVDHPGAPAAAVLPLEDLGADLPVQQDQFVIDGQAGPEARLADSPSGRPASPHSPQALPRADLPPPCPLPRPAARSPALTSCRAARAGFP
jgi:hypothetical protein